MRRPAERPSAEFQMVRAKPSLDQFYLQEHARMVAVVSALTGQRWAAEEPARAALIRAYRSWSRPPFCPSTAVPGSAAAVIVDRICGGGG